MEFPQETPRVYNSKVIKHDLWLAVSFLPVFNAWPGIIPFLHPLEKYCGDGRVWPLSFSYSYLSHYSSWEEMSYSWGHSIGPGKGSWTRTESPTGIVHKRLGTAFAQALSEYCMWFVVPSFSSSPFVHFSIFRLEHLFRLGHGIFPISVKILYYYFNRIISRLIVTLQIWLILCLASNSVIHVCVSILYICNVRTDHIYLTKSQIPETSSQLPGSSKCHFSRILFLSVDASWRLYPNSNGHNGNWLSAVVPAAGIKITKRSHFLHICTRWSGTDQWFSLF